jgi:hypothetical protein
MGETGSLHQFGRPPDRLKVITCSLRSTTRRTLCNNKEAADIAEVLLLLLDCPLASVAGAGFELECSVLLLRRRNVSK